MADPKNRWVVCASDVNGPMTAAAAASMIKRIKAAQAKNTRGTCKHSHSVKISATKPKIAR